MIKILPPQKNQEESQKSEETKKILAKLKHQDEEEKASLFAKEIGFPYIDTNIFPVSTESIKNISEENARKFKVLIIQKTGKNVSFVSTNPTQKETVEFIKSTSEENGWKATVFVVSETNFNQILNKYKTIVFSNLIDELSINLKTEDIEKFEKELEDLVSLKTRIRELPTTQILNILMAGAYKLGASDVHIEPQENLLRIRYRIDGVLHDVIELPFNIHRPVVSRIKMMSGMKINIRDTAQDGTFEINLDKKKIDIRVSILPGNFGETTVCVFLTLLPFRLILTIWDFVAWLMKRFKKKLMLPTE